MALNDQFTSFSFYLYLASLILTVKTEISGIFTPADISDIVDNSCFIGFNSLSSESATGFFEPLKNIFKDDSSVTVGMVDLESFVWKPGRSLQFENRESEDLAKDIVVFPKRKIDRTCLMSNLGKIFPAAEIFTGVFNLQNILKFISSKCDTYKNAEGGLTVEGLHREEILRSLYHVGDHTDVSSWDLFSDELSADHFCSSESCQSNQKSFESKQLKKSTKSQQKCSKADCDLPGTENKMHACEKIPVPSKSDFFHSYLKISKPVIITGAIDKWKAHSKWTNTFFRNMYGDRRVHIKLTPDGEFEGVESASLFENFNDFKIPKEVLKQLPYPDLVVVRPAVANMNLSEFIDIIEQVSNGSRQGFSAYLEYSSIADILPELEDDIEEMAFFDNVLKLEHTNIWLSDGNTLGKLHFDPFDNFLCQLSGRKEVILFEPHDNTKLYESHIPEAMLHYNRTTKTFHRKELVDTTSMVMSPVDILKPNFERFPRFAETFPMNCTIDEGEVLFMPAFWWHEVQSYPNVRQGRNLAVNYWYEPFLIKEFPCPDCPLDINPKYRHLL